MDSRLEVKLEDGFLKVKRHHPHQMPEDYFANPLVNYKEKKRYTLPFALAGDENRRLFLLQEIPAEDADRLRLSILERRELARMEKLQLIAEQFGDQLDGLKSEEEEGDESEDGEKDEDADERENGGDEDSVVLEQDVEQPTYVAVFSHHNRLYCIWGPLDTVYHSLVRVKILLQKVSLNPRRLLMRTHVSVENIYGLDVGPFRLQIDRLMSTPVQAVEHTTAVSAQQLKRGKYRIDFTLPTPDLANYDQGDESPVQMAGNVCYLTTEIQGVPVRYRIMKKIPRTGRFGVKHSNRETWVPMVSTYCEPCAMHIRRGFTGSVVFFKRFMEPIERTPFFRFMESRAVSGFLFYLGRVLNRLPGRRKIALFNEKYSEKAEEGVFELFQMCRQSRKTRCYFILDPHCEDYTRLGGQPGVVAKYSLFYYWLLFNVNYFITTEAPMHLNLMNSNNHYLRLNLIRRPFIFLQHGVTYLKRHGKRSTYVKGRAGEVNYIAVSSDKERDIVSEMLNLSKERIWKTGMLIFDKIRYKHMDQSSEDFITIMLTWKPYEEYLDNFEDSTYYQYTMRTYALLEKYVDKSKIAIVPHPRCHDLLMSTRIRDLVWDRPIAEVLERSKLLITDYSSVCWNSFYQGGGVVFLQPDLEAYETYNGKLIPSDQEYIGRRVFDFESLDQLFAEGLKDGTVNLSYFRTPEDEALYQTINEFHDGKNGERIYHTLQEKGFI